MTGYQEPSYAVFGDIGQSDALFAAVALCVLLAQLFLIGQAIVRWVRNRRAAERAQAAFDPDSKLECGPAMVSGELELAEGASTAVSVDITQEGTDDDAGVFHTWDEVAREVTATPFYLRHAAGQRIRVDATEDIFLVDEIDSYIYDGDITRTLTVQLLPGDQVFAKGELRWEIDSEAQPRGYRDARMGWVLKPPSHDTLHVSPKPLEERFLASSRFHRAATARFVAAFVVCQALLILLRPLGSLALGCALISLLLVAFSWWAYSVTMTDGVRWYDAAVRNDGGGLLDSTTGFAGFEVVALNPASSLDKPPKGLREEGVNSRLT